MIGLPPFKIAPAKVVGRAELVVKLAEPPRLVITAPELPFKAPTVGLLPCRSSTALLTVKLPLVAPSAAILPS